MSLVALRDYIDVSTVIKMSTKRTLMSAIQSRNLQDLSRILEDNDLDLQMTFNNGGSLLHCSIENMFADGVKLFLELGVDVNRRNSFGISPLMLAVSHGAHQSFDLIISHCNCDVNAVDHQSRMTALHRAADTGCEHCTFELLRHGACPDVIDADDASPILLAFNSNHVTASRMLIRSGCDVSDARLLPLICERKQAQLLELYLQLINGLEGIKYVKLLANYRSAQNCDITWLENFRGLLIRIKSLKELCRLRVREILGWPYLIKLEKIKKHIPSILLQYLQFPEFDVPNPSKKHRNCVTVL